jgi:hypothetical protein
MHSMDDCSTSGARDQSKASAYHQCDSGCADSLNSSCGASLCAFPKGSPAASITQVQLEPLLQAAVQRKDGCLVHALCRRPAAPQISVFAAQAWLMASLNSL